MAHRLAVAGVVVAFSAGMAAEPVVVRPRDPRLLVERLARHLDWRDGLPVSYLAAVSQDRDGFLWVSGTGGISRYDGRGFTTVYHHGATLVSGCAESGRVVFGSTEGLYEVAGTRVVSLDSPHPVVAEPDWGAAVTRDGSVWWKQGNRLWRREAKGTWAEIASPAPQEEPLRTLLAGRTADVFVSSRSALWRISPDGSAREVARIRGVMLVIEREDGSILAGANQLPGPVTARVFEIREGGARLLFEMTGAKFGGIAERGQRLWISTDTGLFGIRDGASPLFIAPSETFYATGSVFVDREGSLWMATFRGLVQLPEPETYAVSFTKVSRTLARVGRRTWLSAWGEIARFEDGPEGLEARSFGPSFGIVCGDGAGHVWAQTAHGIRRFGETELEPAHADAERGALLSCDVGPSGTFWLTFAGTQILAMRPGDRGPRDIHAPFPSGVSEFGVVREDAAGTLWGLADRQVCRTSARALLAGAPTGWICESIPPGGDIYNLAVLPSGDPWLATSDGIVRRHEGRWDVPPGNEALPSRWVLSIRPSPSGGSWLSTMGGLIRVVEHADRPEGFAIVEALSAWHGVPTLNGTEATEDADGTLWFATDAGLLKVPAEVRRKQPTPPPVALIESLADGRPLPEGRAIDLPYRRNRLEVRFAALSYRDPTAVRYRHRMRGGDAWSEPTANPVFRFVDLAPGRYRVEVEASLDGHGWSAAPATLAFRVLKPWYLQLPFFAGVAGLGALTLTLLYRTRVRTLLRLERQRTRIAMDLHDEVGSGLGTISVLAGLVAKESLDPAKREEFAARIASVSRELSQALGDIVWSLRPGSGTLDSAWNQIVDRARPLFASGSPTLAVEAPATVPALPLSVVARRALFLIAVEALHNAARHSGATRVILGLSRAGADWLLTVVDDGRGIGASPPAATGRRGLGLDGMRARAGEMGAFITWEDAEGEGTRVTLRFRPDSD